MKKPLTERQRQVYEFIRGRALRGVPSPTVREMCSHFGIRSPNGIASHLRALEKKGLIVRDTRQARNIALTENPMAIATNIIRRVHDSGAELPEDLFRDIDSFLQVTP